MNINEILKWFKKAVPEPTEKTQMVQVGCHFEEFSEMLLAIGFDSDSDSVAEIELIADRFKMAVVADFTDDINKIELLDSLCDQIVTAVGVAHMLGMDIEGALDEVNRSNWSKFENGSPVFDGNGKIKKGASYFKPDLTRFIDTNTK